MWSEIAVSLQSGNSYLICLAVLAFIGTVVIIERFIMLQMVYYVDFAKFLSNFKKIIQAEDLERAINLCKSASNTSLPHITLKALEAAERDPTTIKGTIEEETIDFIPRLEARLPLLPALATIILLIGILGTIDGLWSAFESIEILDTAEKQARLASGIAASLNPTALGLIVGMIFLSAHHLLRSIAIRLAERIHYGVTVLSNLLVPQEVATYVAPPNAGVPLAHTESVDLSGDSDEDDQEEEQEEQEEEEEEEDDFDDASVEDIKDEEEII